MVLPPIVQSTRAGSPGVLLLFLCVCAGCASPGTPRPPSLHLPATVADLRADRAGDTILLHWTTPSKTTDGLLVPGDITAEVCRRVITFSPGSPRPSAEPACSPVRRKSVHAGPSEVVDLLPPALTSGPAVLLEYQVELRNTRERSAGLSLPAYAAAGPAPPAVTGLRVHAVAQGALLQWEPQDEADRIELDRLRASVAVLPANKTGRQRFPSINNQPTDKEPAELRLRAGQSNTGAFPFRPDAGGSLDASARRGETYAYTAQRIRNLVLNGRALEIRSAVSPPASITMRDSFPPQAPAGLEVIAAGTAVAPAIDLSWRPNTEPDLAGYSVYRQESGASGVPARLTTAPILEPGFRDSTVLAGHTYSYSVTALDSSGNESTACAPATEQVRLP